MNQPNTASHTPAYPRVDLDTCEAEPIHLPGAIQPHGVLLALDEGLGIVMASTNVGRQLGVAVEEAIGRPLSDLVGARLADAVAQRVAAGVSAEPLVLPLEDVAPSAGFADVTADVRLHRSGTRVVIEFEPLGRLATFPLTYQSTRAAMARLAATASVEDLADQLAKEIREVLGFDRVMVYRFDADWNGEVIAEDKRSDLNSFAGLHYPASDIPAQARRLYTINWTRLIADVGYEPVPLHPVLDPQTGAPLDLSFSTLRSVSPIHLEYLTNMGVGASMSLSLVVDDELWGLVACHHYSGAHRPSHDARAAAEFLGQVASQQVVERERSDAHAARLETQALLGLITRRLTANPDDPLEALMADPGLLDLVGATGVAASYEGTLRTRGDVPSPEDLRRIAAALYTPGQYVTKSDHLIGSVPDLADEGHTAAGAMRIGVAHDRWLIWLRPELPQIVDWGGDPTNKLLAAGEGRNVRLSPRKSFEKWRQLVRGRSAPWQPWEVQAADDLGRHVTGLLFARSREQVAVAESIQRSVVLDRVPCFPGLTLAAKYRAATTYPLGGDWWDTFALDDGRLAIVVGDAAGHGVSAVSAMTQIRTALRAYLVEGHSPSTCLDRLDHISATLFTHVATVVVAIADPAAGTLQIANAGHPQPLLVTPGAHGTAREVGVPVRPLLGVDFGHATTHTITLPEGAALLFYTDGLIERRGTDLTEQARRFREYAGHTYADDLDGWLGELMAFSDAQAGDDDTTLLALRFDSPPRTGPATDQR